MVIHQSTLRMEFWRKLHCLRGEDLSELFPFSMPNRVDHVFKLLLRRRNARSFDRNDVLCESCLAMTARSFSVERLVEVETAFFKLGKWVQP